MSLREIEKEFEKKINEWSIKYNQISHEKNIEEETTKAHEELLVIKNYIEKRINIRIPNLLSSSLIYNLKKIRETTEQNRKEIRESVQCLIINNNIYLDKNYDFDVIGFNKVPYVHFRSIGVNIGTYNLTIPEEYPIGILYDFEENYSYEEFKKYIKIKKGTPYGVPLTINEDKYLRIKGDFENDKHSLGLVNTGPHSFEDIQFYTGNIELEISGDFGLVSYYFYGHGYMGGQKRLIFSDICLKPNG